RDDAAGEAFDKVAKVLGLGYPGGPRLEALARSGDPRRHPLPRPMLRSDQQPGEADYYDMSFSGLKTATALLVAELDAAGTLPDERPHVAAAFQAAVTDVLVAKTLRALDGAGCTRVVLGGGVSANQFLRERLRAALEPGRTLHTASLRLSLDNGGMVARAAVFHLARGETGSEATADAALAFPGLQTEPFHVPR
ncbi:MAG: tRNA (adenosine(37)-N6)-threonylcarbamoyltransferase complex transferase subunit TsaD, partial [Gemmatimonadetes bacterium]|nr:tRNA (adenosine(37)-N6)-threonylcarbamoyltransferase complex transferase subunit TsaD [Gemmatimonadota bacterium]